MIISIATFYSVADGYTIPGSYFTQTRTYVLSVTAADKYTQVTNSYNLTVQFGCDFTAVVNPNVAIQNDGSKAFYFMIILKIYQIYLIIFISNLFKNFSIYHHIIIIASH